MSCGCNTTKGAGHSCGEKSATGCAKVDTCGNSYKLNVFDWLSNTSRYAAETNEHKFVEVRFKNDRKAFYKNEFSLPLSIGNTVALEANPGYDVGIVSLTGALVGIQMKKKNIAEQNILKVYRLANQKDIDVWQDARSKEQKIKSEAKKIASRLDLEMKITDVEFQGDAGKAIFYYTAEARVDFRQLIREFAAYFKTKIDMKQIGFRQESAKIGGIGSCGRELCCSSWLTDFRSVNTNAARYQQLSINPQKLAGQCGKLKCCLNFELDSYLDALSDFPSSSTSLETEKGKAICIKIDVFKRKMWFTYINNSATWYDLDADKVLGYIKINKKGEKIPDLENLIANSPATLPSVDLIKENNLNRFENSQKHRKNFNNSDKNSPREKNAKPHTNRPNQPQANQQEVKPNSGERPVKKPFKKYKNNNKNNGQAPNA